VTSGTFGRCFRCSATRGEPAGWNRDRLSPPRNEPSPAAYATPAASTGPAPAHGAPPTCGAKMDRRDGEPERLRALVKADALASEPLSVPAVDALR